MQVQVALPDPAAAQPVYAAPAPSYAAPAPSPAYVPPPATNPASQLAPAAAPMDLFGFLAGIRLEPYHGAVRSRRIAI